MSEIRIDAGAAGLITISAPVIALEAAVPDLTTLKDVIDSISTIYGRATPGTAQSAAAWQIFRKDTSGAGGVEAKWQWANGTADFVHVWDDRAGISSWS